jgi:serine/threonine-protein kinase
MNRLTGQTLGVRVRRCGPLPIATAIQVVLELLEGLSWVHAAGIVHCDIQPENVFLACQGEGTDPRTTLLDFGFARMGDTGALDDAEDPESLVGTPSFMSPEQALRRHRITQRSDLFGVAVVLYYSATGRLPFRGQTPRDVLVSIVRSAPVPLNRHLRSVPSGLNAFLTRALAKHVDARFASAREMASALSDIAESVPEETPARHAV